METSHLIKGERALISSLFKTILVLSSVETWSPSGKKGVNSETLDNSRYQIQKQRELISEALLDGSSRSSL